MDSHVFVWSSSNWSKPKRKRQPILSCARCRLFRVKCDRNRPCGSCKLAGLESACTYQGTVDHGNAAPSSAPHHSKDVHNSNSKTPQIFAYVNGRARLSTYTTGWAQLVCEFEEAKDYVFGIAPDFTPIYRKSQALKDIFTTNPINSVFPSSEKSMLDTTELCALLPDRQAAQRLLQSYLETFEQLFPMWEPGVNMLAEFDFLQQVNQRHTYSLYYQMFMMLALGCCSSPLNIADLDPAKSCQAFLDAAIIASKHTIWDEPSYPSLRANCMAVIANLALHDTVCHLSPSSALLGLAIRAAMTLAMHRDSSHFEGMPRAEANMRNRLWTTMMWLDLMTSAVNGLPPLIRADSYDVDPTSTYDNESRPNDSIDLFLALLTKLLPTAELVITKSNSVSPEINYVMVKDCDILLRRSLESSRSLPDLRHAMMLEIFVRRTLLALHLPYSRHGRSLQQYPESHWAVLECSLALLNCHQRLAAAKVMQWFLNIFRDDMQLALIYVILGTRRRDFSSHAHTIPQLANDPREIAWNAIRQSVDIFSEQAYQSWTHYRVYLTSLWLLTALEASTLGGPLSIQEMMSEATENAIRYVLARLDVSGAGKGKDLEMPNR